MSSGGTRVSMLSTSPLTEATVGVLIRGAGAPTATGAGPPTCSGAGDEATRRPPTRATASATRRPLRSNGTCAT